MMQAKRWESWTLGVLAGNALGVLVLLLAACRYGFEFTDEGSHLIWMADPFVYSASPTQFGFLLHPLYRLLNGDLAVIRMVNIVTLFLSGWLLCDLALQRSPFRESPLLADAPRRRLALSAGFAVTVFTLLRAWLPTPNYNSLILQALLLGVAGLLLLEGRRYPVRVAGWLLVGVGIWLAFFVKPTTAVLLAGAALFHSLTVRRFDGGLFLLTLLLGLLLSWITVWLIDGSLTAFVGRLTEGHRHYIQMSDKYTLQAVLKPEMLVWVGLALLLLWSVGPGVRPLIALLLLSPLMFAFGTGGSYLLESTKAGIFWVLGASAWLCALVRPARLTRVLLLLGAAAQLLTALLLVRGLEYPKRQPQALREMEYSLKIGGPGSRLIVPTPFGRYIDQAISDAAGAGFRPGLPVIDMSGRFPGLLYALQARSSGAPWLVGGTIGRNDYAMAVLRTSSCEELSRAWLLLEYDGPTHLHPKVLASFGAALADYRQVARWEAPPGTGGHGESERQQFMQPIRPGEVSLRACRAARGEG
ncbi:MAG: hypothetical protein HQL95_07790 [Magnetococcales bacterium]|nr:hypothetical protein [Magnetococcales bacterium]